MGRDAEGEGYQRLFPGEPQRDVVADRLVHLRVEHRRGAPDWPRQLRREDRRGSLYTYLQLVQSLLAPAIAAVFMLDIFPRRVTPPSGLVALRHWIPDR